MFTSKNHGDCRLFSFSVRGGNFVVIEEGALRQEFLELDVTESIGNLVTNSL